MRAIDKFDIKSAFEALDSERKGTIGRTDFQVLALGLGYPLTREDCERHKDALPDQVTLEHVVSILAEIPRNDRRQELQYTFDLIDSTRKGYIDDADLKRAAAQVNVSLTDNQITNMLELESCQEHRLDKEAACTRLLTPKDP